MTKILSLCMIAHVESKRVAVGYGDERRSVPLLGGPRGTEEASSASCARGKDTSGDSPALWCGPGHSDPVDGLYRKQGEVGLDPRSKGRSLHPALGEEEAAMVLELVSRHSPDQLGLPFFLWTREAVGELIKRRLGLALSQWTVGRHLKRWGFTPQKPARRAYEQNPAGVRRWLLEEYPQ